MVKSRVAIIAPAQLPIPAIQSGGIEQLIENIINQNEIDQRVKFTIISAYSPLTKKREKEYKYSDFKNIHYRFLGRCFNFIDRKFIAPLFLRNHINWGLLQMMRILRNNKYDKVVIFGNDYQIHPVSLVVPKDKIIYYQGTLMLQKANDFLLCDKIFLGSAHSKNTILNHLKELDPNDLKLIQSGIDINYFNWGSSNKLRDEYKIPYHIPIICYLGRIVASKGVVEVLKAALKIRDKEIFHLVLMGSYGSNFGGNGKNSNLEEEIEIKRMVEELGDKCTVTGFVATQLLPEFLSSVDVGLVPSIVEDVSPLTYFQYQAMGIPTIVSDAGGIPEFYSPNYSIMVSRGSEMSKGIANAMTWLLNDKSKRSEMTAYLTKNRDQLGLERYYNNFVDLLAE